ncbi:MAG: hypothetical protein ACR2ML_15005 [Solirubrobacteraceae bacterium]
MAVYLRILRHPRMAVLYAAALVARLPIGINGLAVVLFLREQTGAFAVGGAVAGGLVLGIGLGAPLAGRFVDRKGTRVLLALAAANASGILGLLALGSSDAPAGVLVAVALLTGLSFPPSPSVLRARFPVLLRSEPELVASAYALDAVVLELTFVFAPLLVAAMVATVGPGAALVVSAVAVLSGVAVFLAALPAEGAPSPRRAGGLLGVLRSPGIQTLILTMLPVGVAIGSLEVTVPAFAVAESHAKLAGVLLAIWSLASAAGGLLYGVRSRPAPLPVLHRWLTLGLPLTFLPLLAAPSIWVMAWLLLPAGVLIAPIIATRNELASVAAPPGEEIEALTWPLTALAGGIGLGAAAAGGLIDGSGWRAGGVLAVACAAAAALTATARRGSMPAAAIESPG